MVCNVTELEPDKSDHSKVQDLLHEFKDVFPDELPAELTPERSVSFHFTQFL